MAITKFTPNWPLTDVAYPTRLGRLLEQMFEPGYFSDETRSLLGNWMPAVDVIEEKDAIRLVAELPGMTPDDVKISLENNVLTIQGEKKPVEIMKDEKAHRFERVYGKFERSFTLPTTIDPQKIVARYEAGVLSVMLPKVEAAKPRQISVKIEK
jgi:HSP20 family protein